MDAIHRMVSSGTYEVPAEDVVDAILRHHEERATGASAGERPFASQPPETNNRS